MNPIQFHPDLSIDGDGQTNAIRADRAESAIIDAYDIRHQGERATIANLEPCNASDLIGDILHLCDWQGWDIEEVLTNARQCHADERNPDYAQIPHP